MGGQKQQPVPKNWPATLPYLTSPAYSPALTKAKLQALRTKPPATDLREVPATLEPGPNANVRITPITDAQHPACGQAGLFAARALPPGSLVLPYLGEVHPGDSSAAESDYDLWLDHDGGGGVAVDAARRGNEARFVNDYRGVPGAVRANAEFGEVWDGRRGERGMAVFVLGAGRRGGGGGGIAKGQEILVSYGRGFWEKRREEASRAKVGDAEDGVVPVEEGPDP